MRLKPTQPGTSQIQLFTQRNAASCQPNRTLGLRIYNIYMYAVNIHAKTPLHSRSQWFQRGLKPCRDPVLTTQCSPPSPSLPSQTPRRPRLLMYQRFVQLPTKKPFHFSYLTSAVTSLIHFESFTRECYSCTCVFHTALFICGALHLIRSAQYLFLKKFFNLSFLRAVCPPAPVILHNKLTHF